MPRGPNGGYVSLWRWRTLVEQREGRLSSSFCEGVVAGWGSRENLGTEEMGKGGELWDDSALVDAFDHAVATYKVRAPRLPSTTVGPWYLARRC